MSSAYWSIQRIDYRMSDPLHYGHHNRIPKLSIGLRIGNWDLMGLRIAHKPGAFAWGQSTGILSVLLRNQDFGSVLVVARTQSAGGVIASNQAESETIARGLMLLRIILQVSPKMVGKRIFLRNLRVQDRAQLGAFLRESRELEIARLLESDDEDTLPVLRHETDGINDLVVDMIFQFLGKGLVNDSKGITLVVAAKIFDVLQNKGRRPVITNDAFDFEEEIPLFGIFKAVLTPQTVLFRYAGQTEWLAWEPTA